ncbi:MAG: hypothetical protein K2O28_03535 [Clostridia bacterium]|nr:hypothetical protein [Clostridia bacterium]
MKKSNLKKFLSATAVLAISATAALSAMSFVGCKDGKSSSVDNNEKLISADENHSSSVITTALGPVTNQSSGKKYYVAPDGSNTNDGLSWDKPIEFAALLLRENDTLQPGDTVYVKPGTYNISSGIVVPTWVKGEYNKYIRIINAAYEKEESGYNGTETLCTLDFSRQGFASTGRGVELTGDYIYWYGIDICGAGDNGLYIGGSHNTIEYSEFYNNRDTGLQLGRSNSSLNSFEQWPSYNLIKNCTSHNNYDNETYGENADGFAAKLTVGYGNVFDGCIAYRNSDDGWDLYAKTDSGNIGCVIIYNCVAFENGYLEYTQRQMNELWPTFNRDYAEAELDTYKTRDGDGNGFKLGGSVMEGDVQLHNCLAFYNRMHGVTDNSNPGYLNIDGVTSVDNGAAIDDDKNSDTFGQIIKAENKDTHNNIDVSRQTYSYNTVKNTLSVNSEISVSTGADRYRGSVINSILSNGSSSAKANYIEGSLDADSKNVGGVTFTSQGPALAAKNVFDQLPIDVTTHVTGNDDEVVTTYEYQYNLTGLGDLYAKDYHYKGYDSEGYDYTQGFEHSIDDKALSDSRVHKRFRNDDNSINMGQFYNLKSDALNSDVFKINVEQIGSHLNKGSWDKYVHFYGSDLINGAASSENQARLERAVEALTINTEADAVYQDFEVPLKMNKVKISWSSSDTNVLKIGTEVENSISTSEYITIAVYRPLEEDAKVTLTATLTVGEGDAAVTATKTFNLTVIHGTPSIGTIYVKTQTGDCVYDGGSYIVDRFNIFREPTVLVENGIDYNGKLLSSNQFTYTTSCTYAPDKSSAAVAVKGFTPSNDGVYTVTVTVTLASDKTQSAKMTYTMYVSSRTANVDFMTTGEGEDSSLNVNLDGYMISGNLTNATGIIYALSSPTELSVTKDNIKSLSGVKSYSFRSDAISYQFDNTNSGAYYVYYALANLNDEITSKVYQKQVQVVGISTAADFVKIAGGEKIGEENPSTTIYSLSNNIAFTAADNALLANKGKSSFTGLLNGNGYTVSGINVKKGDSGENGTASVFSKVEGGTIKNIKFDNITISGGTQQVGIVGTCYGGYFHNIALTNINVSSAGQRVGGLIGHVFESSLPTKISNVSLTQSTIASTGKRSGGIIGFIQSTGSPVEDVNVYVSDCYVEATLKGYEQVGGIVGALDNAKPTINYYLEITRCYVNSEVSSTYTTPRIGGIIGYQSGAIGNFKITNCLSIGKLYAYPEKVEVTVALKSASLIVGGCSSIALNEVTNCIATMEEYNSDFDVNLYTIRNIERGVDDLVYYLGIGKDDANWTYQYGDDAKHPEYLKAPYLVLNFLEA